MPLIDSGSATIRALGGIMVRRGSKVTKIIGSTSLVAQVMLVLSLGLSAEVSWRKLSLDELLVQAESGKVEAQHELGKRYRDGTGVPQDSANALKWFHKAADQGYAESELVLGWSYREGRLGLEKDNEAAVGWFRKAAEQGDPWGQVELAFMYETGGGVSQDDAEAVRWYTRAAEQGLPIAQFDLAYMYENGKGVQADVQKAIQLYELSAVQTYMARYNLATLYLVGSNKVPKDPVVAYKWGLLAVSFEFERILHDTSYSSQKEPRLGKSIVLVERISKKLSEANKATGRRLAEEWLRTNSAQLGAEPQDFAEAIRTLK